jgi:hypothetical protein
MSIFFLAPDKFHKTCFECQRTIRAGQIVAEVELTELPTNEPETEYLHLACYESMVEEALAS